MRQLGCHEENVNTMRDFVSHGTQNDSTAVNIILRGPKELSPMES